MSYIATSEDMQIVKQKTKEVYIKLELLNKNYKTIESLEGNLISDNLNVDSKSKQRRSYSASLYVTDSSFIIGEDRKVWIDKYVRVYYGIRSLRTREVKYWLLGTFTYTDANYSYSSTDNTLSITCADLMADYDGTKNGQMTGYSIKIPAGEDIRQSVIALLKSAGITKYIVEDIHKEIPYDLEYSDSVTYCDIWTDICDLYDSWEFFFDIDGTFIWRQIPTGYSEPSILDNTLIDPLFISEKINTSFSGIYNVTEIWGKVFELTLDDRYASSSVYSDGVYAITLDGITSFDDINHLDKIAIMITEDSPAEAKVKINALDPIPIVNDDGSLIDAGRLKAGNDYMFTYRRNLGETIQNCLYLNGEYQAYGIYKETNPECPFSITRLGYEIPQRLNYENLYSDDLCYNQAEYLTYQTTAMMDTITLELCIIPWLDVNQKVTYTSHETGETNQYIIQNMSWSNLDGTMTMTLYRFLESFSYVKNKQNQIEGRSA